MGLDLKLLPIDGRDMTGRYSTKNILCCERDSDMFEAIREAAIEKPVSDPVLCYFSRNDDDGESCYGEITETPYGGPLTKCTAKQLVTELMHSKLDGDNTWVFAALQAMDSRQEIILYWH